MELTFQIQWRDKTGQATPLDQLPLKLDGEHWMHSPYLTAIGTCKEWGRLPSEFDLCEPDENLTVMGAYDSARNRMEAWEQQLIAEEQERAMNKAKAKSGKSSTTG